MTGSEERQLLYALARGDMAALGPVYDAHAPCLYHMLLLWGLLPPDAEDVVQEVFLALAEGRRKLRRIERLGPYLLGMARHMAGKRRTRRAREAPQEASALEAVPLPAAFGSPGADASLEARDVLALLPPEQAEVMVLHLWHGLTFAEVGESLGIPVNTAASRYRYGLEKLRAIWREVANVGP
jgi:RNA polymerase sigma-70 factor (ECF subfamily)